MPNYASSRLTLTGPTEEVARFMRECIRVPHDDQDGEPILDLDAIVPMPSEIRATFFGPTDNQQAAASAATGYENWYDWCSARWGSPRNTSDLIGTMIGDAV